MADKPKAKISVCIPETLTLAPLIFPPMENPKNLALPTVRALLLAVEMSNTRGTKVF